MPGALINGKQNDMQMFYKQLNLFISVIEIKTILTQIKTVNYCRLLMAVKQPGVFTGVFNCILQERF